MAERSDDGKIVEIIDVITVNPRYQQHIIDNARELLEKRARSMSGFVSARVSRSLDGTRVAHATRWRSAKESEAWLDVISDAVMLTKGEVESADRHIYELVETISP